MMEEARAEEAFLPGKEGRKKKANGKRDRPRPGDDDPDGDGGGDGGDDDPRRAGRRPTAPRRNTPGDEAMPTGHRRREGEEIRLPHLPKSSSEVPLWMDAVANAITACAVDPEAAFDWINRTEDDDVDFEELAINAPEFIHLTGCKVARCAN